LRRLLQALPRPKNARQTGVRLSTGVIEQTPVVLQRLSDKSDWSDVSDLPAAFPVGTIVVTASTAAE
jgi:hypothetical protein